MKGKTQRRYELVEKRKQYEQEAKFLRRLAQKRDKMIADIDRELKRLGV